MSLTISKLKIFFSILAYYNYQFYNLVKLVKFQAANPEQDICIKYCILNIVIITYQLCTMALKNIKVA